MKIQTPRPRNSATASQNQMAILSISLSTPLTSCPATTFSSTSTTPLCYFPYSSSLSSPKPPKYHHQHLLLLKHSCIIVDDTIFRSSYRRFSSFSEEDEDVDVDEDGQKYNGRFEEAVALFNGGDYYRCHDFLEALWHKSQDPLRTLFHGILQCAVGFHHLFNQNHKGAMMELGEGLCKLRKMNFDDSGPFHQFEQQISAVLYFIYHTQLELAACADDYCLAMDQSERSYQLLGGYAAGQHLYQLQSDPNGTMYIAFLPGRSYGTGEPQMVKLPILLASTDHLMDFDFDYE